MMRRARACGVAGVWLLAVAPWAMALPALAQAQEAPPAAEASPTAICPDCEPDPPPANVAPLVSLTAPTAGQAFATGSSVAFTATASDSDGSVNRVEFLVDGAEVAQDTTSPYSASWAAVAGSHTVQARAFDNLGASRTTTAASISVSANVLPAVSLTEPDGGEHYVTGSSVAFTATASDSDGSVNRVEFVVDGAEVAQDTTSPYSVNWIATAGSHTVQARAFDNLGAMKTTAAVSVGVAANSAPSVALTAPSNGQQFTPGTVVALKATASDLDGSVNRVEFLVDGAEVGQDTSSAYQVNWAALVGSHTIQARAVDNLGASRTTAAITVQGVTAPSPSSIARQYIYDQYQQLCKVIEPETGATLMGYDGAGNLAWSASGLPAATACDAEGDTAAILARKVVRQYDARNRIVALRFPDGLGDQDWHYTADGLPDQIVTYNGPGHTNAVTNAYGYNHRRLLTGESSTYADDGSTWVVGYGYDANAHLASQTYPDDRVVQYAPNALGQATRVDSGGSNPEAWGATYYPNGALKQFSYGNGIVHTLTQNARGLPERSIDAYGTTKFLDDAYDYDPNGNVAAITDGATGRNQRGNRDMAYDGLDRLTAVTSPLYGTTGAAYAYDTLDNLVRVRMPDRNYYYCYDASNRLTNVKTGGCDGTTVTGLGYDVQGNLANRSGTQYVFDFGNRLRRASYNAKTVEAYRYDGHGRRVLATSADGAIASFYSQEGQLLYQENRRDGKTHAYFYLAGSLVDELNRDTASGVYANRYQHTDALGSPVVVTNGSRTVLERSEYEPYGKLLNRPLADGPGYAGHVSDTATGLSYMQQRYYDPRIGRFLSVDPVITDSATGSNFNRYWYADNNPYTFQDPDGRATCADKNCEKSTIDSTLVRLGILPPAVNGNNGLSNMEVSLSETSLVSVTFQNDDPSMPSTDKPIETSAANMVEKAVLDAGVQSININSSTGGHGGKLSWHNSGHAVDINRVNGAKVSSSNSAATRIQEAARAGGKVRENFGPNIMEKTSKSGGVPVQNYGTTGLKREHQNHVHLSVQPSE